MSDSHASTPQRPYLLRAMHEWMTDNGLTPHIVVDAGAEGLRAPEGHDTDGKLVLNVSYAATRGLSMGNDVICFEARFNGVPKQISAPIDSVLGIYARETGQGMVFSPEEGSPTDPDAGPPDAGPPDGGPPDGGGGSEPGHRRPDRPALRVVK